MSDFLRPHGLHSPWNSPGQNIRVGSLFLLQEIFPTQESNPGLLHCRWIHYQLRHKGSPRILQWVAHPFSSVSCWPRNRTWVSWFAGKFFTNWAIRVRAGAVNAKQNEWKQNQNQKLWKVKNEPKLWRTRLQLRAKYEYKCLTNSEIRHWRNSSVGQKESKYYKQFPNCLLQKILALSRSRSMALPYAVGMRTSNPVRMVVSFLNSHNRMSTAPSAHLASKRLTWIHLLAQIPLLLWGFSLPFGAWCAKFAKCTLEATEDFLLKKSSVMNWVLIY